LAAASKQHYGDLERLQRDLFSNYSTNIIPQKEKTAAVNVTFDLALNQIIDLVSYTVRDNPINLHTFCYGFSSVLKVITRFWLRYMSSAFAILFASEQMSLVSNMILLYFFEKAYGIYFMFAAVRL